MQRLLMAVTLALLTAAAWAGSPTPYAGGPLPDFTLADRHGTEYRLSRLRGKVVMVNFWATYCTPCLREMPSMQRLNEKFRGRPFQILAIDLAEDGASIEAFLKQFRIAAQFPILLDSEGDVVAAWQVTAVPTTFIIDRQGTFRYAIHGATKWDSDDMVKLVDRLLTP